MKKVKDKPYDTVFVMRDSKPRYVIEPFEIFYPDDPRYDKALTYEEAKKNLETPPRQNGQRNASTI